MIVYLADLVHNYFPGLNTVPLNIGYLAAQAKKCLGNDVEISLFKYCDDLLDAIDRKRPAIVGLSNYTWNESLNDFAARDIKRRFPDMPIIMGGPNIRNDREGIQNFLKTNDYIDIYITFEGEIPFAGLLQQAWYRFQNAPFSGNDLKCFDIDSCFSLVDGMLHGRHSVEITGDLDDIPSPYLTGLLDPFLKPEFIQLFESNRGCPYSCSYCTWGSSARSHVRKFSFGRLHDEMEYVAKKGVTFDNWTVADANFGIFPRDIDIARDIREIYEKYHPFHAMTIWWDKNAQKQIVEIAQILKGLSNAYIAFQTFDPQVERLINRKNISLERLQELAESLSTVSERFHTDILLGLPGETMESHIRSLQCAFDQGFDSIGGGEIRLLKGSELETSESRDRNEISTKYRLVQEGFGMYRGHFVAEFEESVRSTKWITEEEMIILRVLRAIFFGAVSIGEFNPLMKYLRNSGVRVVDLIRKMIEEKDLVPAASRCIDWLFEKARNEWFDSRDDGIAFFSNDERRKNLLENPIIKLNYDFLAYLMLSMERYESFYQLIRVVLSRYFPALPAAILEELLHLCKTRNYIVRCLSGKTETHVSLSLSDETIEQLQNMHYLGSRTGEKAPSRIQLEINESMAQSIRDSLQRTTPHVQALSLLFQKFPIYLKPVLPHSL